MKRMTVLLKRATPVAVACLGIAVGLSLVSSVASGAPLVIWPKDTSKLSYYDYYGLEERSCLRDAPDVSIPNKSHTIDLKSTADYRIFNDFLGLYQITPKPGCKRFVVDFRVTKFTNIVFSPNATSKTFEPRGDAGLVDKFGNYGIKANLHVASDKDQCERMVVTLMTGWKKSGWSDFKMVTSIVIPYAWQPSGGDPTMGTCAPENDVMNYPYIPPDPGFGEKPTIAGTQDIYRVAILVGQTKVKSDFGNMNANVGNAASTRISSLFYNGKPIPQMAILHRQDN